MKFHISFICAVSFFLVGKTAAQSVKKPQTQQSIFNDKIHCSTPLSTAAGVIYFGKTFLGNAYPLSNVQAAQTTNGPVKLQPIQQEVLVVNLKKFDCVTFIENMVALTKTRLSDTLNFDFYKKKLTSIRYRNAQINYAARLHYFSDWLFENAKKGILKDITKELGGEILKKDIFYMSFKKDTFYGNMADPTTFNTMKSVESNITKREKFYIPKERVNAVEKYLKDGDIIGITNALEGMDMAHTGFAIWQNGRVYLLHASSQFQKVVISDVPLVDYLLRNKMQTGIMVGRLN